MSIVDLLALFSDPARLHELTLSQKMVASLVTTLLGMGITFLALVVLHLSIIVMAKLSSAASGAAGTKTTVESAEGLAAVDSDEHEEEVVAAITVSLALLLERSPNSLIIRNIKKIGNQSQAWNRAGLVEQMHNNV